MALATGVDVPSATSRTTIVLALAVVLLAAGGEWLLAVVYGENEVACRQTSLPTSLAELPEASSVAPSLADPARLWTINDSGAPRLVAIDENGVTVAHVDVGRAPLTDWEDVSVARCGGGSCVFIADTGDNDRERSTVRLYRLPEPAGGEKTRQADAMDVRYPDGPHDAEAMFVLPDQTIFLITKESPSVVFRVGAFSPGSTVTAERTFSLPLQDVTDADASPDGTWIAVRTNDDAAFYRVDDLLKGDVEHGTTMSLIGFAEPQGEGISFGRSGTVYLVSEGGGKGAPGTLLRLECALGQDEKRPG